MMMMMMMYRSELVDSRTSGGRVIIIRERSNRLRTEAGSVGAGAGLWSPVRSVSARSRYSPSVSVQTSDRPSLAGTGWSMRDKCGADLLLKYDNQKKAGLERSIKAVPLKCFNPLNLLIQFFLNQLMNSSQIKYFWLLMADFLVAMWCWISEDSWGWCQFLFSDHPQPLLCSNKWWTNNTKIITNSDRGQQTSDTWAHTKHWHLPPSGKLFDRYGCDIKFMKL